MVLSAALVAGAVAGGAVATTHLDPWGLLALSGLTGTSSEGTRTPVPAPTVTVTVTPLPIRPAGAGPAEPTVFVPARFETSGKVRDVDVPQGWEQVDQSDTWHDFLDPTEQLRLRIRPDKHGDSAEQAADAAYDKRRSELVGFRSAGVDRVTMSLFQGTQREVTVTYYQFRYTTLEKAGTRHGVEWYLDGTTMLGGFGWAEQLDLVEPAMVRALESIVGGGQHA